MALTDKLTAIGDAIRRNTGDETLIPLADIPSEVDRVYLLGNEAGFSNGYQNGVIDGKQAEYDAFWDSYQQKGNLKDYQFGFCGRGWNADTFKPKYDIAPTQYANSCFKLSGVRKSLPQICTEQGIVVDFSKSKAVSEAFSLTWFTEIGVVDTRSSTEATLDRVFYSCSYCTKIEKFILKEDGSQALSGCFTNCSALQELTIEGTIGKNGFNVSPCSRLSKESITSVINALSTTTSNLTVSISKEAKESAFTEEEWDTLIATKTNWNISLV